MSEGHDDHGHEQSFISKYIFSFDHKMIGKQYLTLVMFMAIVGGALAMLVRLQLGYPGQHAQFWATLFPTGMASGVMTPEFYVMLFTMHGTIMVFFVLSLGPVSGFGNYLIPLQIGARDMAFPFLNMMSFWTVLPGALIILASFFVEGGAAAAGWTAYPPLSALRSAVPGSAMGQTLWLVGMIFFVASFTMGGLNFVVTILNMRAKGLTMMRLPLTTWAQFVVGILGLLSFPALAAGAILLPLRPLARYELLPARRHLHRLAAHAERGWLAAPVAAPLLVPRPPRGLHHHASGARVHVRHPEHLHAPAHLRLPVDGLRHHGHRVPQLHRLGATTCSSPA